MLQTMAQMVGMLMTMSMLKAPMLMAQRALSPQSPSAWIVTFNGSAQAWARSAEEAIEQVKKMEAGVAGYGFRAVRSSAPYG